MFHLCILKFRIPFELWCWRRLLSPLDCKEIKPVNPKGNQPWIFIRRTDAEAEVLNSCYSQICLLWLFPFPLYMQFHFLWIIPISIKICWHSLKKPSLFISAFFFLGSPLLQYSKVFFNTYCLHFLTQHSLELSSQDFDPTILLNG